MASHGTTAVQAQMRHFWRVTELFILEGIQYSWSKIFLKGTKKHKSSVPSFNNANFPLIPLFHINRPAYMSYINYDPLSSAKQASSLTRLFSPAFFQSCPLIIHFLPCSMHQLSPLLKSSITLSFQIHHVKYLTGKCFQISPKLNKHSNIMSRSCLFHGVAMY